MRAHIQHTLGTVVDLQSKRRQTPPGLLSVSCGLAMTSSLSLRPHTSIKCGSSSECGLRHGQLLQQRYKCAGVSGKRARFGTQICGSRSIIRSVASDFAKRTNHTKVNNVESSTLTSTSSHLDAPVSPVDLSLLHPHETHKETPLDVLGKGRFVKNKNVYRQIFVIRSYEVGFDKTASIETITNLFQETSLNHVSMLDFVGDDGMGTTNAMMQNRLIWIVTRMHIEMMRYPVWGDVVQIDSWVSSSGKNGMRRDFLVRDYNTGLTLGRATSNWAMMNQDTRRLSKMPEEVRTEISTQFVDRSVMNEDDDAFKRIPLLDDSAPLQSTGLAPKLYDLDMNQHVNHVKYIDWMLESLPQSLLMSCELNRVTLEYRRECGSSDTLESLAQSDTRTLNLDNSGPKLDADGPLGFTHLLRVSGSGAEVLRGRTQWKSKGQQHHHH